MEKRFQVFASSTFQDLIDERRAVMQALLELDCIPAGMELFPASSDDAWTLITRVIDDCDYYLVILAGRYGSVDTSGVSYTEKECDYAVQIGKPVMGFLHRNPGSIAANNTEKDPTLAAKLDAFRRKVQQRHCKYWGNADELGGIVSRSYVQLLKTHPAEGWVKARYAKTTEELEKMNAMHEQIRVLEKELDLLRATGRPAVSFLAQGTDTVKLRFEKQKENFDVETTWNEIFVAVALQIIEADPRPSYIRHALTERFAGPQWRDVQISGDSFEAVTVQFVSLNLVEIAAFPMTQ